MEGAGGDADVGGEGGVGGGAEVGEGEEDIAAPIKMVALALYRSLSPSLSLSSKLSYHDKST